MKLLVLVAVLLSGCARFQGFARGFSGSVAAQNAAKHRQVCRQSPYVAGEVICEDE